MSTPFGTRATSNDSNFASNSASLVPTVAAVKSYLATLPASNPFNQTLNTTSDVTFNNVAASRLTGNGAGITNLPSVYNQGLNTTNSVVFANVVSPINGLTVVATTGTLNIASGKTAAFSNTVRVIGSDGANIDIGSGGSLNTAAYIALSIDGTMAANSDSLIPSQKAVRTYIGALPASNPFNQVLNTSNSVSFINVAAKFNGLTIANTNGTLNIASGKTVTFLNTVNLTSTDGANLNIGTGGSLNTAAYIAISTDGTLAGNSDTLIATQKATKTYVDAKTPSGSAGGSLAGTYPNPSLAALQADLDGGGKNLTNLSSLGATTLAVGGSTFNDGTNVFLPNGSNKMGSPSLLGDVDGGNVFDYSAGGGKLYLAGVAAVTTDPADTNRVFNSHGLLVLSGFAPVADGTYTVGLGVTTNGTITIVGGVITAIQQAS